MIITSLLDLDLYKLTVGQVIFTYFRDVQAKYLMTVRNGDAISYWSFVRHDDYQQQVASLEHLSLTTEEATYLRSLNLFSEDYIQFLSNRPMSGVRINVEYQNSKFGYAPVPKVSGQWCRVMLYEIFCLSIGNEMFTEDYCNHHLIDQKSVLHTAKARLTKKLNTLRGCKQRINLVEFGTRRRMSKTWQRYMLTRLHDANCVSGTSNVKLAMETGIPVRGTFGHEFVMGLQGIYPVHNSQKSAFQLWANHWNGKLAIALDDTLGEAKFLRDFTPDLMKTYDGLRHDSGDPVKWAKSRISMYEWAGIDTKKKTLFFSDGLTIDKTISLHNEFSDKVQMGFGIGTNLSNDSFTPVPQVVMKIIECNGQPVAKLSNNPEKASCINNEYLEYVKYAAANL